MTVSKPEVIVLPGDGIGPEVIGQTLRIIEWFAAHRGFDCNLRQGEFGVQEWHRTGKFLRDELRADLLNCTAVLFGAMGGEGEHLAIPQEVRQREGLLSVRKAMGVYANLRPVKVYPAMRDASVVRPEVIDGVDFIIVRELLGGVYFGEPRGIVTQENGERRGFNTQVYTSSEIQRIGRVAFELARNRKSRVLSVDKANVMEAGALWRTEMTQMGKEQYPDVALDHMYADNAAIQIIRAPRKLDVLVTDNLFGDILSDCAGTLAGSLGMLPSASLSDPDETGRRHGLYEPSHGSAPDIAGQGKANPLATILSFGMALEIAFGRKEDADLLDRAVASALASGKRTPDITASGCEVVSTSGMGDAVLLELDRLLMG